MDRESRWERLFQHHKYPCFIAEVDTDFLLYGNEELFQTFQLEKSVIGQKFHKVIVNDTAMYDHIRPNWGLQTIYETDIANKRLNLSFHVEAVLLADGKTFFAELLPLKHGGEENSFEKAMTRCMEIYNQPEDRILVSFMELLCEFYQASRAYVYRCDHSEEKVYCIAQYSIDPQLQANATAVKNMNVGYIVEWIRERNKSGIVMADKNDPEFQKETEIATLFQQFKMDNVVFSMVEDANHQLIGFVGLNNRIDSKKFFDYRLLNTISRFVAQDVAKETIDSTLFQLHHRDSLTGLFNRAGYSRRIDRILEQSPKKMGIISVNVNGLKQINQEGGISAGDKHIKKSAQRLSEHFPYDFFRMSGDEFMGVAPMVEKEEFEELVFALHKEMNQEENYDFSFGHAWYQGNISVEKLLREAETVMFINKQEYYSTSQRQFDSVSDTTLSDLLSYLKNDEFMVYLQPQVRLEDGSLYGAEALIRRFDKTNQKMVFPDQFISLYEQKSVIRHVDIFVVETVCQLLGEWKKRGKMIPISVNLSRVTLLEYGIVNTIVDICDKFKVPHELLVIEVTERVGLIENNVASSLIMEFKHHGFNISLDDFGCAYSNIVTLAQIEVDEVKIDKSLVDDLTTNLKNHVLVKNVLSMCNELEGTSTLAEGIEDAQQAKLLHDLGCHLGQGYFYSRPISVKDFEEKYIN